MFFFRQTIHKTDRQEHDRQVTQNEEDDGLQPDKRCQSGVALFKNFLGITVSKKVPKVQSPFKKHRGDEHEDCEPQAYNVRIKDGRVPLPSWPLVPVKTIQGGFNGWESVLRELLGVHRRDIHISNDDRLWLRIGRWRWSLHATWFNVREIKN